MRIQYQLSFFFSFTILSERVETNPEIKNVSLESPEQQAITLHATELWYKAAQINRSVTQISLRLVEWRLYCRAELEIRKSLKGCSVATITNRRWVFSDVTMATTHFDTKRCRDLLPRNQERKKGRRRCLWFRRSLRLVAALLLQQQRLLKPLAT